MITKDCQGHLNDGSNNKMHDNNQRCDNPKVSDNYDTNNIQQ